MRKIGILNGPNLNLTGEREPSVYGREGFGALMEKLNVLFPGNEFHYFQSNIEGEIIDKLQEWGPVLDGIVLNAGGYTHTSVAIGDAVRAIRCPVIEVHLSNIFSRESFRHVSMTGPAAQGIIAGFGMESYVMAVAFIIKGN